MSIVWFDAKEQHRYGIGYYRDCRSGDIVVNYPTKVSTRGREINRVITVRLTPGQFRRIVRKVSKDSIAGYVEVTYRQMCRLGFFADEVSIA